MAKSAAQLLYGSLLVFIYFFVIEFQLLKKL